MPLFSYLRSRLGRLGAELRRRRVPQTALWYLGSAVAVVEAANVLLPSLGAPAGLIRVLAIAAVFGFPIALALAWAYDLSPDAGDRGASWRAAVVVGAVALVSLTAGFVVWARQTRPPERVLATSSGADPAHVAVLGFSTVGGGEEMAAFASNLQARLIDGLSAAAANVGTGTNRLRVVSRARILPFSRGNVSLDSLRRELNVGTVLEGSVESTETSATVRLRLIDAVTGDQIEAKDVVAHADDRLTLLDAVADSVITIIRKRLGDIVRARMSLLETANRDAFDRFTLGMKSVDEFETTFGRKDYARAAAELDDSDSLFAQAERLDKRWIEPIIERGKIAKRRAQLASVSGARNRIAREIEAGIRHARRALALRSGDRRALELRGELRAAQLTLDPDASETEGARWTKEAERDLRASLVGNPTPARALRMLMELAGQEGRFEEALAYGKRAYDEDPYLEQISLTVFRMFEYSLALGRDVDAASFCVTGRARFNSPIFDDCRLSLAAWSGHYQLGADSAWTIVSAQLSAYPTALMPVLEPRLRAMVAAVLVRQQLRDSARAVLRTARNRDARSAGMLRASAGVYGLLGNTDSALAIVRSLVADHPRQRRLLRSFPELRSIAANPRFQELVATIQSQTH